MTFLLLIAGNISRRSGITVVRGFSIVTPSSTTLSRALTARHQPSSHYHGRHHSSLPSPEDTPRPSSTTLSASSIEEDLDAALEDILNFGKDEKSTPSKEKTTKADWFSDSDSDSSSPSTEWTDDAPHMDGSHPLPPALLESDNDLDLKNPAHLSTSNPLWTSSGLDPDIIPILSQKGITKFTPVQAEAFRPVLAGRDVIGRSRTGTGKTLAFGIPSVTRLDNEVIKEKGLRDERTGRLKRGRLPSMLVLCPTRELARQVADEVGEVAKPSGLFVQVFHGGVSYDPQSRALYNGVDIVVGTPGRIIDHIERGNLDLSECNIVVLDEADEMLNMGFAEDVEVILKDVGKSNEEKTQCLLFSATTPPWVKQIGQQYQKDVIFIDSTADQGGARTATTVRHVAIQVPYGNDSRKQMLEDVIAVEISKESYDSDSDDEHMDDIARAARDAKKKSQSAIQQKIFGKTIVFTETKAQADELVSGGVFKSLTACAIHGDVGQKQRDATLAAFRKGSFNVLIATDVAARGIDIQDVDLVVQFTPPRNTDTYVHRSGRTGRAGRKGTSVLFFDARQAPDLVRIEKSLGHGFEFELTGPPSIDAALHAAAKTSAVACMAIPDDTAMYFREAAEELLSSEEDEDDGQTKDPVDVVARCLAAISRRGTEVQSRSLLTGELGMATVEMSNKKGRSVSPRDVMFTVGKLSRMSQNDESRDLKFDSDVGKIQSNFETGTAMFDMSVEDAKKLLEFSKDIEAGGACFSILKQMDITRDRNFGQRFNRRNNNSYNRNGGRGRFDNDRYGGRSNGYRSNNGRGNYRRNESRYHGGGGGRGTYDGRRRNDGGGGGRWDSGGGRGGGGGGRGRYNNDGW